MSENSIIGNIIDNITVEVVYAASSLFYEQSIIKLVILSGSNIYQAIIKSGILLKYPEINLNYNLVGIFGEIKAPTTLINHGDRIEIYRKLAKNPNNIRQQRINSKI